MSDEALQIAQKRRDVKGKREKERYTHLNAEFQRITRRDKKAFVSDKCREIEENNRMVKTGDLFKKIRDTKDPEIPPSSRDEGLRLLHGLATNLATSLQTPQEA